MARRFRQWPESGTSGRVHRRIDTQTRFIVAIRKATFKLLNVSVHVCAFNEKKIQRARVVAR
jgi:hypothetical protein